MKKITAFIIAAAMLIMSLPAFAAEDKVEVVIMIGENTVMINSAAVETDASYITAEGTTLVPLGVISDAFGAAVAYNAESGEIKIEYSELSITLKVGSKTAIVNSHTEIMAAAPESTESGGVMVPIRFIAEAFDAKVYYDFPTNSITVTKEAAPSYPEIQGRTSDLPRIGDSNLSWSMDAIVDYNIYARSYDGMTTQFTYYIPGNFSPYSYAPTLSISEVSEDDLSCEQEYYQMLEAFQYLSQYYSYLSVSNTELLTDEYGNPAYRFIYELDSFTYYEYKVWANGYVYELECTIYTEDSNVSEKSVIAQLSTFAPVFGDSSVTYDLAVDPDNMFENYSSSDLGVSFKMPYYLTCSNYPTKSYFSSLKYGDPTSATISVYSLSDDVNSLTLAEKFRDFYLKYYVDGIEVSDISALGQTSYAENVYTCDVEFKNEECEECFYFFEKGEYCYLLDMIYGEDTANIVDIITQSLAVEEIDSASFGTVLPIDLLYILLPQETTHTAVYESFPITLSFELPFTWTFDDDAAQCEVDSIIYIDDVSYSSKTAQEEAKELFEYEVMDNENVTVISSVSPKTLGENEFYVYTYRDNSKDRYYTTAITVWNNYVINLYISDSAETYGGQTMTDFENVLSSLVVSRYGADKEVITSGEWQYIENSDGTVEVLSYTGSETEIEIPSEIDGKTVTKVGDSEIYENDGYGRVEFKSLTSVTIPDTVVKIGSSAFSYCELESITVSEDNSAYCDVNGVLFTKDMTEILLYPPMKDESTYEIPSGVQTVGVDAFRSCNLQQITVPEGVTVIESEAFEFCSQLSSIMLPNSLRKIGDDAFSFCDSLESITIPANVQSIGDGAFGYSDTLKSINVSSENSTYCDVDGVLFTKDMKTLIQYPYGKTDSTYEIPDGVTYIEYQAFDNNLLTAVTIPDSVYTILGWNFSGTSLIYIDVADDNSAYCDVDGVLFTKDMTELIKYPEGKTNSAYEIPSGVKNIATSAFWLCDSLKSITIPKSVESIEYAAISAWSDHELTIYYEGSQEDWNKIDVRYGNDIDEEEIHFAE